ncbi:hypothetical protein RxyAA322_11230 [Rubrobacter xylanophilus]|uniref:Tyr recombinase domain-containing protein n=1 Tax=Rubrobacter xylanophilus TaxID=49319 RepID=A0A510HH48_9ACTN|nr:site-specific integrase [Rubrobacter xylanophilus]BBL79269.1 hypothetical protein RxyAA322_11230 [Rubrobacter xylanophilus]
MRPARAHPSQGQLRSGRAQDRQEPSEREPNRDGRQGAAGVPRSLVGGDRPGRLALSGRWAHLRHGERYDRNPSNFRSRSFAPLLERAKLPAIRFHDLRHTCATLLLTKNVNPKVVSEMLGHASISFTLDTYSHVLLNMQDSAARALEEALR